MSCNEWISVKDELPPNGIGVLVTINNGPPCTAFSSYTPNDGGSWYRWQQADESATQTPYFSDYGMAVTHWMPMPRAFRQ